MWADAPWRCYAINEKNMWSWGRTHFPADDILKPSRLSRIEMGIKSFSPSPAWTDGGLCTRWGKTARLPRCLAPSSRGPFCLVGCFDGEPHPCFQPLSLSAAWCCCAAGFASVELCLFLFVIGFIAVPQTGIIPSYIKCDLVWSGEPCWP